jgi:hypothetical protein
LCGSVFDEEKPILRKLAQTVHHSSADFGYLEESTEGTSRREFSGHMTGVVRKVNSKKPKDDRDSWGRCPRQLD